MKRRVNEERDRSKVRYRQIQWVAAISILTSANDVESKIMVYIFDFLLLL